MKQIPLELIFQILTYLSDEDYCQMRLINGHIFQASVLNEKDLIKRMKNRLLGGNAFKIKHLKMILENVDENKVMYGFEEIEKIFVEPKLSNNDNSLSRGSDSSIDCDFEWDEIISPLPAYTQEQFKTDLSELTKLIGIYGRDEGRKNEKNKLICENI